MFSSFPRGMPPGRMRALRRDWAGGQGCQSPLSQWLKWVAMFTFESLTIQTFSV